MVRQKHGLIARYIYLYTRDCVAERLHDKVYALHGLLFDGIRQNMKVDYNAPVLDLNIELPRSLLVASRDGLNHLLFFPGVRERKILGPRFHVLQRQHIALETLPNKRLSEATIQPWNWNSSGRLKPPSAKSAVGTFLHSGLNTRYRSKWRKEFDFYAEAVSAKHITFFVTTNGIIGLTQKPGPSGG
jgi:hypothetical protein